MPTPPSVTLLQVILVGRCILHLCSTSLLFLVNLLTCDPTPFSVCHVHYLLLITCCYFLTIKFRGKKKKKKAETPSSSLFMHIQMYKCTPMCTEMLLSLQHLSFHYLSCWQGGIRKLKWVATGQIFIRKIYIWVNAYNFLDVEELSDQYLKERKGQTL